MTSSSSIPSPEVIAYEQDHFYDSLAPKIYIGAVVCIVVTVGTTALRLVARRQRKAPLKSDDWLMILAVMLSLALAIIRMQTTANGVNGHHLWEVAGLHPNEVFPFAKEVVAFATIFCLEVGVIRASILMLYLRLFPTPRFRIYVWIVQVAQLAFVIAIGLCFPLQCIPLRRAWNPSVPGRCINTYALLVAGAVINIFMDFAVFFLPLPVLWGLQVSTYRKFALCGVFVLGSGICFVCVYRAVRSRDYQSPDFTWKTVTLGQLNLAESMGGIFCSNMTVIYPLLANPLSRWTSSISSFVRSSRSKGASDKSEKSGTSGKLSWSSRKIDRIGESEIALTDLETGISMKMQPDVVEVPSLPRSHGSTAERSIEWSTSLKDIKV